MDDSKAASIGCPVADLETPALCLDLEGLEQRISSLVQLCRDHGQSWRPPFSEHLIPEFAQRQLSGGATGIAVENGLQAAAVGEFLHGDGTLLISQPLFSTRQLTAALQAQSRIETLFLCDHFVHAERLSRIAQQSGRRVPVLIELNVGNHRPGVRLGSDGRELARGLSTLPGLQVKGLAADLGSINSSPDREAASETNKRVRAACGMLAELKRELLREGHQCDIVSVAAEGEIAPLLGAEGITELRTGSLCDHQPASGTDAGTRPSILSAIAAVYSRSKLERAVIDVGWPHFSMDCMSMHVAHTLSGRPLPDVKIAEVTRGSTTLDLGPESRDLIIGSKVVATPTDAASVLHAFETVYAVRNGIVKDVWASASR